MTEISDFVAAQLDREYRDAQLISSGGYQPQRWEVSECVPDWPFQDDLMEIYAVDRVIGADPGDGVERYRMALVTYGRNQDEHIARYDPERICLEIEAKRALLAEADEMKRSGDHALSFYAGRLVRMVAAPYAKQAGFKPEWRVDA